MRKLGWILGGVFFALLVAVISVPLFVDVEQYRPVIVSEANKRINGQLELGKLKLSLWGTIKIHAESIRLRVNGFPEPLVDTKDFHVELPILSILSGSPQVVAVLDHPRIDVVKNAAGRMNAMELMNTAGSDAAPAPAAPATQQPSALPADTKSSAAPAGTVAGEKVPAAAPGAASTPAAPAAPAASEPTKVPALLAGARLGLRINKGDLRYVDQLTKSNYQVAGLDLTAKNIGLGAPMSVRLEAPVKGATPTMSFEGPISADADLRPTLEGSAVKSVSGKLDFDASKLRVEMKSGAFRKTDSMPLKAHVQLEGTNRETLVRALDVQFADFKVHGKGRLTMEPQQAQVNLSTDPGSLKLEQLQAVVPPLAAYQLKGAADFNADIDWKPELLKVSGDLRVADGSFFMKDMLKAPLQFRLQAGFSESTLNIVRAGISGPETELELVGNVKNFLAPQFTASVTGKSFNVDKTIVLPSEQAPKQSAGLSLIPQASAAAPAADVNPMLELGRNPIFAKASGTLTAQIGRVIAYGATMEQVMAKAALQNMVLKITDASLKAFGGSARAVADLELGTPSMGYKSQGSLTGVSAREALKAYFPKYQNTLEGSVSGNWNVSGGLYPATARIRTLKGTAKIAAQDGAVRSVDFEQSINSVISKVPFLKNQKPIKIDNGFKSMTADLRFDGGVIRAEPIEIHPRGQGFMVKGKSTIQESLEQESFFDVYDPQGQLPRELQNPGKPAIALRVFGPITSPKTDIEYTVKRLAGTAGKNIIQREGAKALGNLLGIPDQPGQSDQDKLKKAAEELKKRFKF